MGRMASEVGPLTQWKIPFPCTGELSSKYPEEHLSHKATQILKSCEDVGDNLIRCRIFLVHILYIKAECLSREP